MEQPVQVVHPESPNQLVADHRTGVKLQNAKSVLDGNLEPLIQAFIDHRLKSA